MTDGNEVRASEAHSSDSCGGALHVDVTSADGSKDHVPATSTTQFLGAWAIGKAQSDEIRAERSSRR